MARDARSEQLARLKEETDRSLRSFLRGTTLSAPTSGTRRGLVRRTRASDGLTQIAVLLDDERMIRALAKEIKRLITEDKRRGLAV